MTRFIKGLILAVTSALFFIGPLGLSAHALTAHRVLQKKVILSPLFSIEARGATFEYVKGHEYYLTISVKAIDSILEFSDRPQRIERRIDINKFVLDANRNRRSNMTNTLSMTLMWYQGETLHQAVFAVSDIAYTGTTLRYDLQLMLSHRGLKKIPMTGQIGKITTFIAR